MELSDIFITIDTREKNQKRIDAVKTFFEKHGAEVEFNKLDLCDYHIQGDFRNKEINLGIEAKSLQDFAGSHQDLPDKLLRSFEYYSHVGLFVETGKYTFSVQDDGLHCIIKNHAVQDGSADVLQLAVLENMLGSFASNGIYVRQLCYEAQFPFSIYNVLINLTKEVHNGLRIKAQDEYSVLKSMLNCLPGIGTRNADKLLNHFGNFYWMSVASKQDIQYVLGNKLGNQVYEFFHSEYLISGSQIMVPEKARAHAMKGDKK